MWPSSWTGAIVIGPPGTAIPASRQQPAGHQCLGERHRRRETAGDAQHGEPVGERRPRRRQVRPGPRSAVSPDSSSASHSAFGHSPFSASLTVSGSHRSWKDPGRGIDDDVFGAVAHVASAPRPCRTDRRAAGRGRKAFAASGSALCPLPDRRLEPPSIFPLPRAEARVRARPTSGLSMRPDNHRTDTSAAPHRRSEIR